MEIAVFPTLQQQLLQWRLVCFESDNNGLCNVDCFVTCLTTAVCSKEIAMDLGGLQILTFFRISKRIKRKWILAKKRVFT
jgi:hypothetical protein